MPNLGILGKKVENNFVILKSVPSNLSNSNISWKNENALIWDQKMPYLGIFGLEILKNHCQLQNSVK